MIIIVATITLTTIADANAISGENKRKIKELSDMPRYIKRFANVGDMPTERDLNYIGRKYDLPDGLLYAMFWKETHYKCNVKSSANAFGCFQFQYWSAKEVNLIGKIGKRDYDYRTNPWIAADAAARYLKIIQYKLNLANSRDPHSIALMLAGYNAGIGKIRRDGNELNPPMYTETQYYIEDILGYVEGKRHIVQRGEGYAQIAKKYNLTQNQLSDINPKKTLHEGDFVLVSQPKKIINYTIKPGDTIFKIARINNSNVAAIGKMNNFKSIYKIPANQTIKIPVK